MRRTTWPRRRCPTPSPPTARPQLQLISSQGQRWREYRYYDGVHMSYSPNSLGVGGSKREGARQSIPFEPFSGRPKCML